MYQPPVDLLRADRLVWGGSLYPPPDIAPARHRFGVLIALVLASVALWGVVVWILL